MDKLQLFDSQKIRSHWDGEKELWYFSIIDIISALSKSTTPRKYWSDLKTKLKNEGIELSEDIGQLKMKASDGKMRLTDVATTEQVLRLIQSIPSPNAEPFKQWLAKVGYERIEAIQDPEKSIDTAMQDYSNLGYSKEWINQRLKSIEVRKDLTNEWEDKGLKKENLRDNMTNLELVLNMLAEATTTEISKKTTPQNIDEHKNTALQGGEVAGNARKEIESKTGEKIVNKNNANDLLEKK